MATEMSSLHRQASRCRGTLPRVAVSCAVVAAGLAGAGCRRAEPRVQSAIDEHRRGRVARSDRSGLGAGDPMGAADRSRPETGVEAPQPAPPESLLPRDVLSLDAARGVALEANPDIHSARARLEAAQARIQEAQARYFPTLLLNHTSARTFQTPVTRNRLATLLQPTSAVPVDVAEPQTFVLTALLDAIRRPLFGGASGSSNPFSEHTTSLTASWTLFDGFIREAQVLSAKYVHSASKESQRDVRRLVVHAVDTAYFRAQLGEEQIRIAMADQAFSDEQLSATQKLMQAGHASQADVDNFRIRGISARAAVTAAVGAKETARVVLAELMGLGSGELPAALGLSGLAEESPAEMATPGSSAVLEAAMRDRPDLRQLEQLVAASLQDVRAAKGFYSPSVLLNGSWGYDRAANVHYSDDDQSSAGALEVRWELYSGGVRDARVRIAEAQHTEAAANLTRLRLKVQSDVRSAVIALQNAQEQIRLHRETLVTAIETRRIIQAAYVAGKESLTRLNEAQRDVITADANLALARIRLRQAWSDLDSATGRNVVDGAPGSVGTGS